MTSLFKNRETILLVVVAAIGITGLLALQLSRKTPATRSDERSLIQSGAQSGATDADGVPKITVPGNLISVNEQPEAGRPFLFKMANYSQSAVYELELGDGSGRKPFVNGILKHTYYRPGAFEVTLYAKYEGQEVKLQTITKQVANAVKKDPVAPIIDY